MFNSIQVNRHWLSVRYAGVALSLMLGVAAIAISQRYSAPVMLFAILIGLALHPAYKSDSFKPGINWCARPLLLSGVALLGFRVDLMDISAIGPKVVLLTIACVGLTIVIGTLFAKSLGMSKRFAVLVSGSVAICGVSAAVAISSVLPKSQSSERELALTIAGVTTMSTLAMILYPLISQWLGHSDINAGIFIGASIHDVAQVVGAGYSVSDDAGSTATIVKLIRVSALLPIVLIIGTVVGRRQGVPGRSKLSFFPPFLIAYIAIATLNSFHVWPDVIRSIGGELSRLCLIISLIAIGLKTNLGDVASVGKTPLVAVISITIFMAALALSGVWLLR